MYKHVRGIGHIIKKGKAIKYLLCSSYTNVSNKNFIHIACMYVR